MTEKLTMHTRDLVQENIQKIAQLFPNCVTETLNEKGYTTCAIDFEALKRQLSDHIIAEGKERYVFTWPEKSKTQHEANEPATDNFDGKEEYVTLRPCRADSKDFDNTQNIYIEGDNLNALKLLRETYLHKIKMIYIDPPYNTGEDFLYNDSFSIDPEKYKEMSGDYDEQGNRWFVNSTKNGRLHTNWLNIIYPRLLLSKDFLTDDGMIFISIDDNEVTNLKKMCDEIFGEQNFVAQLVIDGTPKSDPIIVSTAHEYCLVYVRNYSIAKTKQWGVTNPYYEDLMKIFSQNGDNYKKTESDISEYYKTNKLKGDNITNYKYVDKGGIFRKGPIDDPQGAGPKDLRLNPRTGRNCLTPSSGWRCTIDTWNEWVKSNLIDFPSEDNTLPAKKTYLPPLDVLRAYHKIQTRKDTEMLKKMFDGKKVFLFPKPLSLIETFVEACTSDMKDDEECYILDFFSGSATTAHAIMNLNAKDGKKRHYILVQISEDLKKKEKHVSGNRTKQSIRDAIEFCDSAGVPASITEIAKERIRRAGESLSPKTSQKTLFDDENNTDFGFRVFKIDSSNMIDVRYTSQSINKDILECAAINIKPERSNEDILFQVMLEMGIELSAKISILKKEGKEIFVVDNGYLVACFDEETNDDIVTEIAKLHPFKVVLCDNRMSKDSSIDNAVHILQAHNPSFNEIENLRII